MQQEYDQNQAFLDDMARFEKFGFIRSKIKTQEYAQQGLIEFSEPRPNFPYHHYRLTEIGNQEVFAALARKGCIELIVPRIT